MDRRVAGVGSSPALPNKSTKTRLWKQLKKLDRKLNKYKYVPVLNNDFNSWIYGNSITEKQKLDQKRKKIRLKLKGYL